MDTFKDFFGATVRLAFKKIHLAKHQDMYSLFANIRMNGF